MRIIKLGIISLIIFFIVITLLSLLIPSKVRISRAVNISAEKDSIVNALADLRRWEDWNYMVSDSLHPNPVYEYNVIHSDDLQVEIRRSKPDTLITVWHKKAGRDIAGGFTWQTSGNVTVVQWYFDFTLQWYPWEKFSSILFDKQLGPQMERSLRELKTMLERRP